MDPWGFSGHDPDNPPEPDPDAPPVVVTADRDESIILKILTFNPDPMEVLETVGNFALGFGAAVAEDLSYGTQKTRYNGGMSYHVGKVVGHVFDMTLGAIGTIGGGTFATVTAPTGVGTVLGVSEAIYASSVMVSAGKNLSDELASMHFSPDATGGGSSSDRPRQITRETDMTDVTTWPEPPGQGPFEEGAPSRPSNAARGEKSLFDAQGGEWRPHRPDQHHEPHWDYKPVGKNAQWRNIDLNGNTIPYKE